MLSDLLNAVVSDIQGLSLSLLINVGNTPTVTTATVVKRKGVKRDPGVDQPFQITVCQSEEPEVQEYIAFGNSTTSWKIDISIIAPNQADWLNNLDNYVTLREKIRSLYVPPKFLSTALWATTGVWDIRPDPRVFMNREQMANLYDDSVLYLKVRTTP